MRAIPYLFLFLFIIILYIATLDIYFDYLYYESFYDSKPEKLKISAGILTHYAPDTLRYTLETYKNSGFTDIVDDLFVVIQKSEREQMEIDVCNESNVRYILMPDNGHMAWGFKAIYDNARNDILLFLENDFIITASKSDIYNFLYNSVYFLYDKNCDIVRGRSRTNPGEPNHALHLKNTSPLILENSSHLSEVLYWDEQPHRTYPSKISQIEPINGTDTWYVISSKSCNYTNNPYLCKRSFFKSEIYPYLFFGENIENRLTPIWSQKDFTCVVGPGLFTHNRMYDGHN